MFRCCCCDKEVHEVFCSHGGFAGSLWLPERVLARMSLRVALGLPLTAEAAPHRTPQRSGLAGRPGAILCQQQWISRLMVVTLKCLVFLTASQEPRTL